MLPFTIRRNERAAQSGSPCNASCKTRQNVVKQYKVPQVHSISDGPMHQSRRPLRVLQVIAPHRYSGAERIAVTLADGLQRRGHEVVFACNGQPQFLDALRDRGLACESSGVYGKLNPLPLARLVRLARRFRADVIHTHLSSAAWLGGLAGKSLGVPVLAHVHALNTRTWYGRADMLAACSQGVKDHLVSQGLAPERIQVIYNGIDLSRLERLRPLADVRRDMSISDGQPVVGVAAHLTPKKGQRYVVEAAALLREKRPNLLCYLLGEGEMQHALADLARALGIGDRVRLMGYRPDAVDLMQAMDIVLLPSIAKEGLGLCLVEASALGKPVIGSDAPGINEVIEPGRTGLLVPPGDARALADAIDYLLADRDLCQRMGQAGRERVAAMFDLERMVDETEQLYYRIIDDRAPRKRR